MSPSKTTLQKSFYDLTIESTTQQIQKDDEMWKSRLAEIPKRYEKEFIALEAQVQNAQVQKQYIHSHSGRNVWQGVGGVLH